MKTFKQHINEDPVKKVTSGEYAGRWMVKYIWNRKKETGIFDNKKDAIKHAQVIRKTKGAKLDENSKYIVAMNPNDKKWYVMGHVGNNKWMPVSNGFKNKAQAQKWAKSQDKVDDAARGEIGGCLLYTSPSPRDS